jgi:methylmalonyl-CoA mutase N-terminal domain/subunit
VGGSYFVEAFTRQMKQQARDYFQAISDQGGMITAIENGFFRREIANAAFAQQRAIDAKEKLIVGVNAFQQPDVEPIPTMEVSAATERSQIESLRQIKSGRSSSGVDRSLDQLRAAAQADAGVMPALIEAAEQRVTVQECMNALAEVLGRFRPAATW